MLTNSFLYDAKQLRDFCLHYLYEHPSIEFKEWKELIPEFENAMQKNKRQKSDEFLINNILHNF